VTFYGVYVDPFTLFFSQESEYKVDFVDHYPYGNGDELRQEGEIT
jgi:hypothetical protein